MNSRMDGRKDNKEGRIARWMDGWMEGRGIGEVGYKDGV